MSFDGQILYMAGPSQDHQALSMELFSLLLSYIKQKGGLCKVFAAPFDVKLSDDPLTIVQPDLMIICDKSKLDGHRCNGAPDFIIEIVSPANAADDYVKKLYYYQKYGVQEYWIVAPMRKSISVNYFEGGKLSVPYDWEISSINRSSSSVNGAQEIALILSRICCDLDAPIRTLVTSLC